MKRLRHTSRSWVVWLAVTCGPPQPPAGGAEPPVYGAIEAEPLLSVEIAAALHDQSRARIIGAYRTGDGTLIVANERELHWYGASGKRIRSAPTSGESPYRVITWMRGYGGDSVIAYDAASSHVIVFDAKGRVAREFGLRSGTPPGMTLPHSVLPDGSLLAVAGPSHVQQWPDGWWAVVTLLGISPTGEKTGSFGTALRHPCGQAVERCAGEFKQYSGAWTAGQRGVYQARPDRTEIRWTSNDSVMELRGPQAWRQGREAEIPTYSRLLVDSSNNLWAQSGDLARAAVFTPEGELAGTVALPPHFQLYQIGSDFVVGIIAHVGAERVDVHQLRRVNVPVVH